MPDKPSEQVDYSPEMTLLQAVRTALSSDQPVSVPESLPVAFMPAFSQVYITLFQHGLKPLRWGARKNTLKKSLQRIVDKLKANPALQDFAVEDGQQCRLLFEMVTAELPCKLQALNTNTLSENRFEPGITGIKYTHNGILRYFMPTDAVVHSIMTVSQLLNFLAKKTGIASQTESITERVQLMQHAAIDCRLITSLAFVSYQDQVLSLYRGYPMPTDFNQAELYRSTLSSLDWLLDNMQPDGRFLYFYDPYLDTQVDFDHPKMINPLYNNILRHSGGTVSLIRGYELSQDQKYLLAAKKSLDFLVATFRTHEVNQQYACYPFFNKKSKLGGAGLALVALLHYYRHTQDECYRQQMDGLVRHILSRVAVDGEMIGYYLHPQFNNGDPLIDPPDDIKKQLFSFYYPGEALLGLALYDRYVHQCDPVLRSEIRQKSLLALDFLVTIRPVKYQALFLSLPADAWLMQAIEEWVKVEGFDKPAYYDFVFNDAHTLLAHMYTEIDAPYPDYAGGFYYQYGDHVYHDASRCEGLMAAYYLAVHRGDLQLATMLMQGLLKAAKGLLLTRHTPESTYAHRYPEKSLHSFRFKLTRQWVRVDSVQHAACFYARLLPVFKSDLLPAKSEPTGFKLLQRISKSGFSEVYKACDLSDAKQLYAIKWLTHHRFINFISAEVAVLREMNQCPHIVKFHGAGKRDQRVYLKFDYVAGDNLRELIRKKGVFNEADAFQLLGDLLEVLGFAHSRGILHLDIKPENILLHRGKFTLIDWGLAKKTKRVPTLVRKGDPIYLAPEFFLGFRETAADFYALGCVLYFVLMGHKIYGLQSQDSLAAIMAAHFYKQPELPSHLSSKMQSILGRLLDKNAAMRADLNGLTCQLRADDALQQVRQFDAKLTPDLTNDMALLQQLSADGVAYAQMELGLVYQKGEAVPQDHHVAATYFEQAAAQVFAPAQTQLGLVYLQGLGRAFDFVKARFLLELAADRGHAVAQYYLGEVFEFGYGVNVEQNTAINWYLQAAQNADKKAFQALARLQVAVPEPQL